MFASGRSNALTERDVLDALKGVKDPDLQRDLVDLGMIKEIQITETTLALTVELRMVRTGRLQVDGR